jgi:hypothetical protein
MDPTDPEALQAGWDRLAIARAEVRDEIVSGGVGGSDAARWGYDADSRPIDALIAAGADVSCEPSAVSQPHWRAAECGALRSRSAPYRRQGIGGRTP